MEAVLQGGFALSDAVGANEAAANNLVVLAFVAGLVFCAAYPWLLRVLDTPYTRWCRKPRVLGVWTTLWLLDALVLAVGFYGASLLGQPPAEDSPLVFLAFPAFPGVLILSALALLASIHAFRVTPAGPARERARAFMYAFGARDLLFLLGIVLNYSSGAFGSAEEGVLSLSAVLNALGTLVYVPLLAYGILKTQLFDLDLKLKVGISRGTVVTFALIVVLGAAKVAEFYLSRTFGFIAGGVAAGTMLVVTPRLNKIGDKVANAALPQVQPTPAYLQFKKLEVYRAAVEATQETGGIDERERATLERLRTKLGLSPDDAAALEAEVASQAPAPAAPAAA